LPPGAVVYRGKLYVTASSASSALLANNKWDTPNGWILKSAKRTTIKGNKGTDVTALAYLDFLDLLVEKTAPDAKPKPVELKAGIVLDDLRQACQAWRKPGSSEATAPVATDPAIALA